MMEEFTQEEIQINEIQQYLMGTLAPDKMAEIKSRIQNDPTYAHEVEKYRFLIDGFRTLDAQGLKEKMGKWDLERSQNEKTIFVRPWTAIAAAIILLIGLGFLFQWMASPKLSSAELFAEAMTDFEPDITARSSPTLDIGRLSLLDALDIYQQGQYAQAIPLLEGWIENQKQADGQAMANAYLCLGISQLRSGQSPMAIEAFQSIPANSVYYQHALWYQAMVSLKTGETATARQQLQSLGEDPYYQQKVADILKALE